ncbi:hypothetical protein J6590_025890 [Homalodisca vitripennis]|nr:hypothetical protein J6590_025890 [Homalodisca vitripennis]
MLGGEFVTHTPSVPCTDRTREREFWSGKVGSLQYCPNLSQIGYSIRGSLSAIEVPLNKKSNALHLKKQLFVSTFGADCTSCSHAEWSVKGGSFKCASHHGSS